MSGVLKLLPNSRQEDLLRAMAAAGPRCGFGEQFCRAVITKKGDLSIAKGDRTTIERCLENFDKAPERWQGPRAAAP